MIIDPPIFESEMLNMVVAGFSGRSKALKHKNCQLEISKEDDEGIERLNIDSRGFESPPIQTRISVWSDMSFYCQKCQSSKNGWKFNIYLNGDVTDVAPEEIVNLFESSQHIDDEEELMASWKIVGPYK